MELIVASSSLPKTYIYKKIIHKNTNVADQEHKKIQ